MDGAYFLQRFRSSSSETLVWQADRWFVFDPTSWQEFQTCEALQCLSCCAEAAYKADARPNRKVLRPIFSYLSDPRSAVRRQAELSAVAVLQNAKEERLVSECQGVYLMYLNCDSSNIAFVG